MLCLMEPVSNSEVVIKYSRYGLIFVFEYTGSVGSSGTMHQNTSFALSKERALESVLWLS